jgi:hypothetical protein
MLVSHGFAFYDFSNIECKMDTNEYDFFGTGTVMGIIHMEIPGPGDFMSNPFTVWEKTPGFLINYMLKPLVPPGGKNPLGYSWDQTGIILDKGSVSHFLLLLSKGGFRSENNCAWNNTSRGRRFRICNSFNGS